MNGLEQFYQRKIHSIIRRTISSFQSTEYGTDKKLDESLQQIESLTQQVRYLTKAFYGSKSEKSKYQAPDGQCSLFDDDSSFNEPEHTEEQSTETVTYTVVRKVKKKTK